MSRRAVRVRRLGVLKPLGSASGGSMLRERASTVRSARSNVMARSLAETVPTEDGTATA
ncbi:hypothetical protein BAUCODRAFT_527389 [Baudoinia panamericana UAMH 10762]|uniref:Uncharacterized protein n=1 Tax=Baudoinia panamericana (strain UAMH 10762) TaxID=717646 RepID=M2N7T6_BAUPA|nr:uncharacterized protein BAUCODRAFT_527389 [Baudoinia panamericana UAMH 10762]EMC95139.1 hypothetical protein BAUCODRAFT_527389 [Baudoinia panamericana UAMH 10762]